MNKNELIEYADYLLKIAISKTQNITEAEDLVQETLLAAFTAIKGGTDIDNTKAWLLTVLNRKFCDGLRKKYRTATINIDFAENIPDVESDYDAVEKSEAAAEIRRCLSQLTQIYREVMVRYYMRGESVKKIAAELKIPENTVKSRLKAGRERIRKEMDMENYAKQSYEPEKMWISISGQEGKNDEPFSLVKNNDLISMNLLILAYEKSVTITDLSKAIGISVTYIEPIIERLVSNELMKRINGKVYTDFIIFRPDDRTSNIAIQREMADKLYKDIWRIMDSAFDEFHECKYYKSQSPAQKIKLDSFFAIKTIYHSVMHIRDKICDVEMRFQDFPDRPNGGKWYAMGNIKSHTENTEIDNHTYYIDGELTHSVPDYLGKKNVSMCAYDTALGKVYLGYNDVRYVHHTMTDDEVAKMMYAIHIGKYDDLPLISNHCFDNVEDFIKLGFLSKDSDGKVICDIPVIEMNDRWNMFRLSDKYRDKIAEKFCTEIMSMLDNPAPVPCHIKSVPEWQRYMHCGTLFPMMVILRAREEGLFDLGDGAAPAVYFSIE